MKTLLFYDSVVVLNRDTHREPRLKPQDNLRFAASTNCVPLALVEFGDVAREYPIVFARLPGGLVPVALLGLRDAENLYLNEDGKWDARYVPAFVRRYPFVAVQDNNAPDKLLVCMDEQFPGFNGEDGERLFAICTMAPDALYDGIAPMLAAIAESFQVDNAAGPTVPLAS